MKHRAMKWFWVLFALMGASLFALSGCSKASRLGDEPLSTAIEAKSIVLSLQTGAEVYAGTFEALEREKQIESLTAYLFTPQGDYVETVSAVPVFGATGEYKVKSTQAGSYQMVLVANLPVVTDLNGKVISDLDQHLVTVTAGNATHNNFVMRNQGASISIQTYEDGGSDYRGTPILMERLSARFDINLLATGYQIKSVQLKNAATQSQLYNNNGEGKQLQTGTAAAVNAAEYTAHLYSYENSSATNHTSLEIICSYSGVELKPITVTFPTVKRNHLYMVKLTEKPSDNFKPNDPKDRSDLLNVNVEVLDWFAGTVLSVKKDELDNLAIRNNNPLSYVAHYNVTRSKTWDTTHTIPSSKDDTHYLINWHDAMNLFSTPLLIQRSKELYQLPTREEWNSIIPYERIIHFTDNKNYSDNKEQVSVAGKIFNATSDYRVRTHTITGVNNGQEINCNVALRFKGNNVDEQPYKSAWLYYFGPNARGTNGLHIYCVNVANDSSVRSVDDLNQSWWNAHIVDAVYRFFPAAGYSLGYQGSGGHYWSSTEMNSDDAYRTEFDSGNALGYYSYYMAYRLSVRLFSPAPVD